MGADDIPKIKPKTLDDRITIPLERALKEELVQLKARHGVDHLEWIRRLIRRELPNLKAKVA